MTLPSNELVVLVDRNDRETGTMEKLEAHRKGELHRAISVFIVNSRNELLLQKRARSKYHSPGLWTNTCCSHPRPGETPAEASTRRLFEEMGLTCPLHYGFSRLYKADVGAGLTEYEFDHVFFGISDVEPIPQPEEVEEWEYVSWSDLENRLITSPASYSPWLHQLFDEARKSFGTSKLKKE